MKAQLMFVAVVVYELVVLVDLNQMEWVEHSALLALLEDVRLQWYQHLLVVQEDAALVFEELFA